MELSSFFNNRNKYHFFFQKKIEKISDWKQLVHVHINRSLIYKQQNKNCSE
jgi:hypothetical protein